jgi:ParB family chromosome partitioning protein
MTPPAHKRKALGKGLGALIPQKKASAIRAGAKTTEREKGVMSVPIEDVRPNRQQPRKSFDDATLLELSDSIKLHGLMQPVLVRQRGNGFEIIAGERRWRACQKAGLKVIEVVVRDLAEAEVFEWALIENIQREDLNPIEEAEAYRRLLDSTKMTQEQLALRVAKDRSTVANALRLLKLPEEVRRQVIAGVISMGHARALLSLESGDHMIKMARDVVKKKLSVREVERRVRDLRLTAGAGTKPEPEDPYFALPGGKPAVDRVTTELVRSLGTKVRIVPQGKRGKIEIDFSSSDELERLIGHLR